MSVFSAADYYARLHRVMSFLDEENIKILETMKEYGPRNLQQIARKSKLPYSTVYARVSKLQSLNALLTWAHPCYSAIGLSRATVLARSFPGKEFLTRDALAFPGYWLRIIRCTGEPNGYYSLHAVPSDNQQDFHNYLDQLVSRGVMKDYQIFWVGESYSPLPNFDYYDPRERRWRFEWKEWQRAIRTDKNTETRKVSAKKPVYDKKDLIILKELQKDARITLADLSKMLGMTLPATKYRFDRLIDEGFVADNVIQVLPFAPEVSDLCEFRLDFTSEGFMKSGETVFSRTSFVLTITPIRGLNSIALRVYIPRQEMNNLLGFFSSLAREDVLANYSFVQLDPATQQSQTFSYKTFEDETGWKYDNRAYLQEVSTSLANWQKRPAEETIQVKPVSILQ
ncbi:MAG TPA: winged helix-turn-helix transcriptional regulator [Candidatus Bathyarchaeia archaeon]|nr:winged helix-turn-helix transcriptional regulator [Candidatus Bathyarchaeia archaeon]